MIPSWANSSNKDSMVRSGVRSFSFFFFPFYVRQWVGDEAIGGLYVKILNITCIMYVHDYVYHVQSRGVKMKQWVYGLTGM